MSDQHALGAPGAARGVIEHRGSVGTNLGKRSPVLFPPEGAIWLGRDDRRRFAGGSSPDSPPLVDRSETKPRSRVLEDPADLRIAVGGDEKRTEGALLRAAINNLTERLRGVHPRGEARSASDLGAWPMVGRWETCQLGCKKREAGPYQS